MLEPMVQPAVLQYTLPGVQCCTAVKDYTSQATMHGQLQLVICGLLMVDYLKTVHTLNSTGY